MSEPTKTVSAPIGFTAIGRTGYVAVYTNGGTVRIGTAKLEVVNSSTARSAYPRRWVTRGADGKLFSHETTRKAAVAEIVRMHDWVAAGGWAGQAGQAERAEALRVSVTAKIEAAEAPAELPTGTVPVTPGMPRRTMALETLAAGDLLLDRTTGRTATEVKSVGWFGENVVIRFMHGGSTSYPRHFTPTVQVLTQTTAVQAVIDAQLEAEVKTQAAFTAETTEPAAGNVASLEAAADRAWDPRAFEAGDDLYWTAAPKCGCASGDFHRVSYRGRDRIDGKRYAEVFTCSGTKIVPLAELLPWSERPQVQAKFDPAGPPMTVTEDRTGLAYDQVLGQPQVDR